MQIIPSSWRVVGLDMDGDGLRDPQNIYDAAGAAMVYLCAGGRDLSTADGLREAVLSYNDSPAYLSAVLEWKAVFDEGRPHRNGRGAVRRCPRDAGRAALRCPSPRSETRVAEPSGATPTAATTQAPDPWGRPRDDDTEATVGTAAPTPAGSAGDAHAERRPARLTRRPTRRRAPSPDPTPTPGPPAPSRDPEPHRDPAPSENPGAEREPRAQRGPDAATAARVPRP